MAKFRYTGKSVQGEIEDEHGNIVPNILDSCEAYGFKFHARTYTEVPEDEIAYWATVPYSLYVRRTRKSNPKADILPKPVESNLIDLPVLVVDKLRGNREFEEQAA